MNENGVTELSQQMNLVSVLVHQGAYEKRIKSTLSDAGYTEFLISDVRKVDLPENVVHDSEEDGYVVWLMPRAKIEVFIPEEAVESVTDAIMDVLADLSEKDQVVTIQKLDAFQCM